ncbi:MAG: DUF424 family protein [Candidatus Micrarchaeia archaeon]
MYLKMHPSPDGEIVALCDVELIGKVLASGKAKLDLSAYAPFYLGKKIGETEAVEALKAAQNANLVGKKALAAAKKAGLPVSHAKNIGGVPHLQIYRMPQ